MNNPETLATLGTQEKGKTQTKQDLFYFHINKNLYTLF